MYYHCRPLKYVEYGKIYPPPLKFFEDNDKDWLFNAYVWIGYYCGYCPQIWLSRSHMNITGFKNKYSEDDILFAFDIIKGFPVDYDSWCTILNPLINCKKHDKIYMDKNIIECFNEMLSNYEEGDEIEDDLLLYWKNNKDFDGLLKKFLFVEKDQIVVPSLNLKCAKEVICRNERQKKQLRKMGFIEDRIKIKNIKKFTY